jgi:hypothetical protein
LACNPTKEKIGIKFRKKKLLEIAYNNIDSITEEKDKLCQGKICIDARRQIMSHIESSLDAYLIGYANSVQYSRIQVEEVCDL